MTRKEAMKFLELGIELSAAEPGGARFNKALDYAIAFSAIVDGLETGRITYMPVDQRSLMRKRRKEGK